MAIICLAAGLLGAPGAGAVALGATPVGSQFQVNTYTTGRQQLPSVAVDADGDFVVVWESRGSAGSDTSYSSIQGQRYDASGDVVGSQFQINTYTTGGQTDPSVAVDAEGNFVVVWNGPEIQGQRYDASGNPVGSEFQVNTYTTSGQSWPSLAAEADGDFVVVWGSNGSAGSDTSYSSIQGQRYDSSGNAVGFQFQVNTYTTDFQSLPSVAADADGDFVVVWYSSGSSGSDPSFSVQGQRYDSSGNAVGSQFQVNTYTTGAQWFPSIGVSADGDFLVAWESGGSSGTDTSYQSVQGRLYDASGSPVHSEDFQVNTYTTGGQGYASVAAGAHGDFVVVWNSGGSWGSDTSGGSIQGQRYDSSGNAVGSQFQVNTYTTGTQFYSSVAAEADGDFVVVWDSDGSGGSDTSGYSIQGQRYTVQAPQVPSMSPPGMIGLAALLLGIAAAGLRGRRARRS